MRKTAAATLTAAAVLLPLLLQPLPSASASATATASAAAVPPPLGECAAGELCLWAETDFRGARHTHELAGTDIESCVPLPSGTSAQALANRTGRPVTTYQSRECAETGEFETYPGGGTWVPRSPYRARAFKIWEN